MEPSQDKEEKDHEWIELVVTRKHVGMALCFVEQGRRLDSCWEINKSAKHILISDHPVGIHRLLWVHTHQRPLRGDHSLAKECSTKSCANPTHYSLKPSTTRPSKYMLVPSSETSKDLPYLLDKKVDIEELNYQIDERIRRVLRNKLSSHLSDHLSLHLDRFYNQASQKLHKLLDENNITSDGLHDILRDHTAAIEAMSDRIKDDIASEYATFRQDIDRIRGVIRGETAASVRRIENLLNEREASRFEADLKPVVAETQEIKQQLADLSQTLQELSERLARPAAPAIVEAPIVEQVAPVRDPREKLTGTLCELFIELVGDDIVLTPHDHDGLHSALQMVSSRGGTPEEIWWRLRATVQRFARATAGQSRERRSPDRLFEMLLRGEL